MERRESVNRQKSDRKDSKVVKRNERGIEVEKVECEGISKNKNESFPKSWSWEPTILVQRETKRWMKRMKQGEKGERGGIRTFLSLRHFGREANEDVPPKLSSYLVPQLRRTPSCCSSLSLSITTECSPSPSPPPGAHPSLQPVSSATAALSATSEPGCFAIII